MMRPPACWKVSPWRRPFWETSSTRSSPSRKRTSAFRWTSPRDRRPVSFWTNGTTGSPCALSLPAERAWIASAIRGVWPARGQGRRAVGGRDRHLGGGGRGSDGERQAERPLGSLQLSEGKHLLL